MKKGDTLPVKVEGITVTQAVVESVEADRATLLIEGVRAVVAIRVSLTDATPEPDKEVIIDGVDRAVAPEVEAPVEAPTEAPKAEVVEAPVTTEGTVTAE